MLLPELLPAATKQPQPRLSTAVASKAIIAFSSDTRPDLVLKFIVLPTTDSDKLLRHAYTPHTSTTTLGGAGWWWRAWWVLVVVPLAVTGVVGVVVAAAPGWT